MHQRIAQTLRYLAGPINQHTARTNAAEGSATLRERREDQEHVDEYLQERLLTFPIPETKKGERGVHQASSTPVSAALAHPPRARQTSNDDSMPHRHP